MIENRELPRLPKKGFDSHCPFCKSRAIYQMNVLRTEVGCFPKLFEHHAAQIELWKCAVCDESFELF